MREPIHSRRLLLLVLVSLAFSHCNWMLDWEDDRPGVCPNGIREEGETCDGTDLGGQTCEGLEYTGGALSCRADCTLDPGECTLCGNGVAEGEVEDGEACDGEDYRGVSCSSEGYYGGQVNCSETCELIWLGCEAVGKCGDGIIQDLHEEVCDLDNFDGRVCSDFDRWSGDLMCNNYCNQFVLENCSTISYVAAGMAHTCLIDDRNLPYCWGDNRQGQAAAGEALQATRPVWMNMEVCGSTPRIMAGFDTTCIFCDETYELKCFGDNRAGQLGLGDTVNRQVPVTIPEPDGQDWAWVGPGADHLCGVVGTGDLVCSGGNAHGQLGTADQIDSTAFVPVVVPLDAKFFMVASGDGFTCAIDDLGQLWCWGRNDRGQLGDGTTQDRLQPVALTVAGGATFTWISAGTDHVCALDDTSAVWCWGAGANGRLGNGQLGDSWVPAAVHMPPSTTFHYMACQASFCCGHDNTLGRVWCWGANDSGQLGIGAGADRSEPIQALLPSGQTVSGLALGGSHVCVSTMESQLYCWGQGSSGQLGQGDTASSLEPVRVFP